MVAQVVDCAAKQDIVKAILEAYHMVKCLPILPNGVELDDLLPGCK